MAAGAPPPFATGEAADSGYPADFHMRIKKGDVTEKVRSSTWILLCCCMISGAAASRVLRCLLLT